MKMFLSWDQISPETAKEIKWNIDHNKNKLTYFNYYYLIMIDLNT